MNRSTLSDLLIIGRRCRFRHAHPGATRGLCSLLGDLPPPPYSSFEMEPPLGGFRLPLRYFQITSSSGRWERQARPVSWRKLHDQTRGQDWGNPQKRARQGLLVLRQPKLSTRPSERKTVAGGKTFRTLHPMSAPSGDRRGPWTHPVDVGNHAVREDNPCVC